MGKSILYPSNRNCDKCGDEGSMSVWEVTGLGGREQFVCSNCYNKVERRNMELKAEKEKAEKAKKEKARLDAERAKSGRPKARWE